MNGQISSIVRPCQTVNLDDLDDLNFLGWHYEPFSFKFCPLSLKLVWVTAETSVRYSLNILEECI
jgi:hypothetical protein